MSTFSQISHSRRAFWVALVFCAGVLGVKGSPCFAFPVARMRGVRPVVETRSRKKGWVVARERTALVFGDRVRTGPHAGAQILFNNGTQLVLRARTQIEISEPETADRPLVVRVFGALGEVFVRAKGPTEIRTAAGTAAVRGTSYSVRLDGENQTTLTVSEGRVAFFNPQGQVEVRANEQSSARVGSAPTLPTRVDASGLLAWTGEVAGLPLPFELPPLPSDAVELKNAKTQFQSGDARGAQRAFRALLNSPNADQARAGLALSLLSNGQRDQARAEIEGAATPFSSGVRALLLLQSGDARGAQRILEPLASGNAAPFQLQTLLSLSQIEVGDARSAIVSAQKAVASNSQSAGAWAALSLAQFFARTNDKIALSNARRAVELDPFSPLALLSVGRIEAARGNLDEARQALEQAVSLSPELPGAQRDLGALELALDRLPRAERAFRASLELAPDDARTLAGLGTVLLRRGRRVEAWQNFNRAVELAPDDLFVRASRAAFFVENGELDAAAREGDFLLARQNTNGTNGNTNNAGGTNAGDNRALAVGDDPTSGALWIRLSEAALFRQKLNDALRFALQAVRLLPDSAPAQYQLGRVFLEQGRTTQAQSRFQLAAILDSEAPRPRYALGFTQQLVAQGNDVARPLGQIAAAREGAPNVALSLQNQSSPGASERLQAAIQDPTSVRAASRSFGDVELAGRLGTQRSATGEISVLRESDDQRGLTAFGFRRDTTKGVRAGAGSDESLAAVALGRKAKSSPSALFGYASFERVHPSVDGDFDSDSSPISTRRGRPLLILGANLAKGQSNRTRFLFQVDRNSIDSSDSTGTATIDFSSIHLEARHDRRLSDKWRLSAGASAGQRRYDVAINSDLSTPDSPLLLFNTSNAVAHNAVVYARLAFEPTRRLKLEDELKIRSFGLHTLTGFRREPSDPLASSQPEEPRQNKAELLPSLVATWRVERATLLRFRARRALGAIEDFELLSPSDLFGFDTSDDVPTLDTGGRGHCFELEANHTFGNASFLRVGLFRVEEGASSRLDTSESFAKSRVQGLRVGFEGLLNRRTAFFSAASWNGSRGQTNNNEGGLYAPSTLSGLPDYSAEVGLQFLGDDGILVQPSVGYIGPRFRARFDGSDARQRPGGFPLFNLRIGKRFGLRRSFYVEASNLFDRSYSLAAGNFQRLQPGRQLRIGATLRF